MWEKKIVFLMYYHTLQMPEVPNIKNVLETFIYYWYENIILDSKVLQMLFAPEFKIKC